MCCCYETLLPSCNVLQWPPAVKAMFQAQEVSVAVVGFGSLSECLAEEGSTRPIYSQSVFIMCLPLTMVCLVLLYMILQQCYKERDSGVKAALASACRDLNGAKVVGTIVICSFAAYTMVAQQTMQLLTCITVDGKEYLQADLSQVTFTLTTLRPPVLEASHFFNFPPTLDVGMLGI